MLPKPTLEQVDAADLERLVTDQVHEGRTLDYKRDIALSTDEHRRELARDVSSFANAAGGDLIFGVEEAKDENGKNLGFPEKVVGVECPNFDDTRLRIESIVRENIDPRIHGVGIRKIDGFERGPVIIVRIPRNWNAPHMVSYRSQTHFYSRNSSGKHPLDVREIRAAFLEGTEQAERVRRFRDERLGSIMAGETPVPVAADEGIIAVMHVVPVGSGADLDLARLSKDAGAMRPPWSEGGWNTRFNLDGFVSYSGPNDRPQFSYLQAFRHGAFEAVELVSVDTTKNPPRFYAISVETFAVQTLTRCLANIASTGYDAPVSLIVALLGAKGARIHHGDWDTPWAKDRVVDRDPLILPDVLIESIDADLPVLLRPMFDALWQSSGWERSFGYDAQGNWDARAHR